MRRRRIPGTSVQLTEIGFGGAPVGNLYRAVDAGTARDAVRAAWRAGVRYFDTAPHYGLGLSERRLGEALAELPRDEFVFSTKVGRLIVPAEEPRDRDTEGFDVPGTLRRHRDYSRDGVLRSIEASLERTGLDRFDLVLVHDPDEHWAEAADQALPTLAELRDQGVIGAVGVGMNRSAMLRRFLAETPTDVVMLAGRYTLLEQDALDDVLRTATEHDKGVIAAGVFNSGLLAEDRPPAGATYDYLPAPADLVARAVRIAEICEQHGSTLPAAALAFPLAHPAVVDVTLGMRDADQVVDNLARYARPVPGAVWQHLREEGLLRPDAPVPGE